MKTRGFERRFSQHLAPVLREKPPKPLRCLHFTFIQQALSKWFQLDYNQLLTQKISTDNIK
ncbi:hypothetical protein MICAF_2340004 [Microcystis aeruginosa PCC 9807]|uniref:Uncharacterized protein n=1 Tax=Microcystis aeruginosa PCC 9807 TaxID=1160283 RepID=I4H4F4_MICAE|nr:hypothetical protein MICAF_2340004 [Microcystis aeruginosa PCC 9807]